MKTIYLLTNLAYIRVENEAKRIPCSFLLLEKREEGSELRAYSNIDLAPVLTYSLRAGLDLEFESGLEIVGGKYKIPIGKLSFQDGSKFYLQTMPGKRINMEAYEDKASVIADVYPRK